MMEKILVLEDEPPLRKSIGDALRAEGYEVTETGDGDHAVELLNDRFDLVIADFVHPGVDGLKLTEYVHMKWPHTPIIFMTAYLSSPAAEELLQRRAEFLAKPINLASLLATVKRLLSSAQGWGTDVISERSPPPNVVAEVTALLLVALTPYTSKPIWVFAGL